MTEEEAYCPYCGDDVSAEDLPEIEKYYEEHKVCPHWDYEKDVNW